jgi:hypothetical protein
LGAAACFQGAHLGLKFRQEIAARAHWGEIVLVLFGKGELAIDVSAQEIRASPRRANSSARQTGFLFLRPDQTPIG